MAPSAIAQAPVVTPPKGFDKPDAQPEGTAPHEIGMTQHGAKAWALQYPGPPTFTDKYEEREYLKGRLALAFRIFGKHEFDEGVAGHITLRDPVLPDHFWVNPFGVAFKLMKSSDLILVNQEGEVVDGPEYRVLNYAAYMIHVAVHNARPDVLCAAHSHTLYSRTYASLAQPLDFITQDSCVFYNDHAVLETFNGVILAKEEGEAVANAIGNKKAAILTNHGIITVAQTIEAAVFWFITLEKSIHTQMMADWTAAARGTKTVKISEEDCEFTYRTVGTPKAGWFSAKPAFDMMAKESGDEYLQ